MAYCRECGIEIGENDKFCKECGADVGKNIVIERVVEKRIVGEKLPEKTFDSTWYLAGVLVPFIGLIGGIIFLIQGRRDAYKLIIISTVVWGFFIILVLLQS